MLNGIIEKFYFIKTYIYILLCSFKVKKNKSLYTKDSEYFETRRYKIYIVPRNFYVQLKYNTIFAIKYENINMFKIY
ncbi:hypothetical protein PFUGPA_01093 [Plasmodium falciparum Palo Alto/Uganda]|uniref:Uncharacterized protein n=2 Tax=Plasmodium falciparum TaxID=5833 RepID=W4J5K6_PLAFP|nr:hypothetical protein PFUGPA_01093 [Plasmodium falciparum Palo Alto/Uganda]ETW61799.1 hypothetical protein PFMC_02268 [Plasmodium falciparum CAMP/Malaysia]